MVAKHEAAKQATVELTKNVGISRENLARVKKDNNSVKDRVATAQAALNQAEVRRGGRDFCRRGVVSFFRNLRWTSCCCLSFVGCGGPCSFK